MVKVNTDNLHNKDAVSGKRHERAERSETAGNINNAPVKGAKTAPQSDKVELSGKSAEFGKLVDEVKQLPDVRHTLVNELKQKIASGSYDPSAEEIADAILRDEK